MLFASAGSPFSPIFSKAAIKGNKKYFDSSWSYEQGVYAAPDASLAVKYCGS